jgi:CRP-like cAMP-binding protein
LIQAGGCAAFTEEYGRVKEYGPGDFFGELAVLVRGDTRKATVRTSVRLPPIVIAHGLVVRKARR